MREWVLGQLRRLHEADPWATWQKGRPAGFVPLWTIHSVRALVVASSVVGVFGVWGAVTTGYWWGLVTLPVALVGVARAWTLPTFRFVRVKAQTLSAGVIYADDRAEASSDGVADTYSSMAANVLDVFVHYGYGEDAVWIALAGGQHRFRNSGSWVRLAEKEDWFAGLRPKLTTAPHQVVVPEEVTGCLAHLWDAGAAAEALPEDVLQAAIERPDVVSAAQKWGLVRAVPQRRGVRAYQLSQAGIIVLAAACRRNGVEIFEGAEESPVSHFENSGNIIFNSPGAAAASGGSSASSGGGVSSLNEDVHCLLEALRETLGHFAASDRDVLIGATESLDRELQAASPDEERVKRAVRVALQTGGTVLLGALGSGVWEGLATWSGLQ